MKVLFSEFARQELMDAVAYYELEYKGLGKRFKDEVRKATLRIAEYPCLVNRAWRN
ncbi:type II toxin-antitoxin system RelE/ParE family toxin [Methylomonas sp. MgM2]